MPSVTHDDAPLLADLMPWSVAPPRLGRAWPAAPDPASLKARWDALMKAEGPDREALFGATRARTPHSAVGQLPGQSSGTGRLARASGPCAEPVRIRTGPFADQSLIPHHRLIDAARPELWRVADEHQVFAVEHGCNREYAAAVFKLFAKGFERQDFAIFAGPADQFIFKVDIDIFKILYIQVRNDDVFQHPTVCFLISFIQVNCTNQRFQRISKNLAAFK
jgi:hypothetical protein